MLLLLLLMLLLLVRLLFFFLGLVGAEARGDENGTNHEVEEHEEDAGREPAVHGRPDRRRTSH